MHDLDQNFERALQYLRDIRYAVDAVGEGIERSKAGDFRVVASEKGLPPLSLS
jgi:hypothetical protein